MLMDLPVPRARVVNIFHMEPPHSDVRRRSFNECGRLKIFPPPRRAIIWAYHPLLMKLLYATGFVHFVLAFVGEQLGRSKS